MFDSIPSWIPQAVSVLAMIFQILSFQFKKNSTYLVLFGTGGLIFAISFFLMGKSGYASAVINLIGVFKSFTFAHPKKKLFRRTYMLVFIGLYIISTVAVTVITKHFDWLAYLILLAQIVGTVAIWTDSARIIRIAQLAFISPAWLLNCSINFSIGGILCHVFMIVSILISIKRYGWDGLDNKKAKASK